MALSGKCWLVIITKMLPRAMAGAMSETNPSSGYSSWQAMPITPIGSLTATVIPRTCAADFHFFDAAANDDEQCIVRSYAEDNWKSLAQLGRAEE